MTTHHASRSPLPARDAARGKFLFASSRQALSSARRSEPSAPCDAAHEALASEKKPVGAAGGAAGPWPGRAQLSGGNRGARPAPRLWQPDLREAVLPGRDAQQARRLPVEPHLVVPAEARAHEVGLPVLLASTALAGSAGSTHIWALGPRARSLSTNARSSTTSGASALLFPRTALRPKRDAPESGRGRAKREARGVRRSGGESARPDRSSRGEGTGGAGRRGTRAVHVSGAAEAVDEAPPELRVPVLRGGGGRRRLGGMVMGLRGSLDCQGRVSNEREQGGKGAWEAPRLVLERVCVGGDDDQADAREPHKLHVLVLRAALAPVALC